MTKFIRVSEVCGNDVLKAVLINCDMIEHIKVGNKGNDTFIKLITPSRTAEGKGSWFFVKESLEEIERQIFTDSTRPPIMMNADEYAKATGHQRDMGAKARHGLTVTSAK